MAEQRKGGIAWTEQTWNPIRGCRRQNKDCINCYAEVVATRFSGPGQPYEGLVDAQGRWNGTIRVIDDHMFDPFRWQRPRMIFVNSMSDLFFPDLQDVDIDRIVAVMALAQRHTFQVLTKRPARMAAYLESRASGVGLELLRDAIQATMDAVSTSPYDSHRRLTGQALRPYLWPLPTVWWGASMGHQAAVDEFLPQLDGLRKDAAVVWASIEPQTEFIRLGLEDYGHESQGPQGWVSRPPIDWAVVGGESGAEARPYDIEWARALQHECHNVGVAFFMKQLGRSPIRSEKKPLFLLDRTHGSNPEEWPADLRVREYPTVAAV